jgi:hypothetical protein
LWANLGVSIDAPAQVAHALRTDVDCRQGYEVATKLLVLFSAQGFPLAVSPKPRFITIAF